MSINLLQFQTACVWQYKVWRCYLDTWELDFKKKYSYIFRLIANNTYQHIIKI